MSICIDPTRSTMMIYSTFSSSSSSFLTLSSHKLGHSCSWLPRLSRSNTPNARNIRNPAASVSFGSPALRREELGGPGLGPATHNWCSNIQNIAKLWTCQKADKNIKNKIELLYTFLCLSYILWYECTKISKIQDQVCRKVAFPERKVSNSQPEPWHSASSPLLCVVRRCVFPVGWFVVCLLKIPPIGKQNKSM